MSTIKTYPFQNSTILRVNSEQDVINTNPEYQRKGGVWGLQKKQLLIDSIINDYDIPKLYFHYLSNSQRADQNIFEYSIIDGRQRIEAIWEFIDGKFPISEDFEYLIDPSIKAAGLTYSDLAIEYPKLKIRFDSYILPVILVETDDYDLIEDMFSRLNEAVPLNASEKRNALGGPMATVIREVAENIFFTKRVKFNNNRYQHREVVSRLLFIIYSLEKFERIVDTKKPYMDKMVLNFKDNPSEDPRPIANETLSILDEMNNVFSEKDALLRSQSTITVYFLLFKEAMQNDTITRITRRRLMEFNEVLERNRKLAEEDITEANYEYLEYERMSQQGTNDAYSIKERTRIMSEFLGL